MENGPSTHPGATHVEDEDGKLTNLASLPSYKRAAIAKTLLSASGLSGANVSRGADASSDVPRSGGKTVYRHLRSGDILLVNRQVSVHFCFVRGKVYSRELFKIHPVCPLELNVSPLRDIMVERNHRCFFHST